MFESLITRFMGETASKLRLVFDAMVSARGVYLFDEFDAIGSRRGDRNDIGEIRRVLNSFLLFLEKEESDSLVIAATNHPELLDPALFRRFDDVIRYDLPKADVASSIMKQRLALFSTQDVRWEEIMVEVAGLSQSELSRAADEAAKKAVLSDRSNVTHDDLSRSVAERQFATNC